MANAPVSEPTQETTKRVAGVRFTKVGKLYHFTFDQYPDLQAGDFVIVNTVRGRQMGQVMGFTTQEEKRQYRAILRTATPRDLALREQWQAQEAAALDVCREVAQTIPGYEEAKFIAAQYNYDGTFLTFLLTAEGQLDTIRLVQRLHNHFDCEIETRQIGARDVAKLLGGLGACGIERCCSTFLTDFSPVSIKMAKAQGITLNPSEITGMCGRLRCCLVYEYEQYIQARKHLPRRGKRVGTPFGEARVLDVHPLQDAVTVFIEDVGPKLVAREDIVPLDELQALQDAARKPCSKHGDEPCDCGKPKGQRRADQTSDADDADIDDDFDNDDDDFDNDDDDYDE